MASKSTGDELPDGIVEIIPSHYGEILSAPEFMARVFPALAAQQGQLLSAQRVPQIAGQGVVAYAAYLGALDALGVDITKPRAAASRAFAQAGVRNLTLGERRAAESREREAREAREREANDRKAMAAARIQAKALGPAGTKALLDLVDQTRGTAPVAARTSTPGESDDWGG